MSRAKTVPTAARQLPKVLIKADALVNLKRQGAPRKDRYGTSKHEHARPGHVSHQANAPPQGGHAWPIYPSYDLPMAKATQSKASLTRSAR